MNKYAYRGPVMEFDRCICESYSAETRAVSESKARTNIAYQFKKEHKLSTNRRIRLPGKITLLAEREEQENDD